MPLEFTNPLVALVYRPAVDQDRMIHTGCYSGLLSNVHECAAERLYSRKSSLIELRPEQKTVHREHGPLALPIRSEVATTGESSFDPDPPDPYPDKNPTETE